MDRIRPLRNPIRDYPWGSRHAIAELQGRPVPSPGPEAELWMGAHPSAPSRVCAPEGEVSLDRWIARGPDAVLGEEVAARYSGQLPFLLKVLAAEQPLSIQAHPSQALAREGFAREEAAGVPRDAPERCYRDPNHKPELLCALGPFEALCGFRPATEIADAFSAYALPGIGGLLETLRARPEDGGVEAFFTALWTLPAQQRRAVADRAAGRAGEGAGGPGIDPLVARLAKLHPGDLGVLAPLLLNRIALSPGEALYLAAGQPHAYLGGVGVEIMASSDNVLRGGLTTRHVAVPELLRALEFAPCRPEVLRPEEVAAGEGAYRAPAEEFSLSLIRVAPGARHEAPDERAVEILLATAGHARVTAGDGSALALGRGESLLVPAAAPPYAVTAGDDGATLFKASVGQAVH